MADISDADAPGGEPRAKKGGKGLLVALLGATLAGGGAFYATYSGMLDSVFAGSAGTATVAANDYAFVPLDTMVISLGPRARAKMLKFTAQLEVEKDAKAEVAAQTPRIMDVLNGYLRALEEQELEDPAGLTVLRAQMLRRINTVVGGEKVRDLLIIEFVLN